MAEGHRRAQALALARATAQARHLGVDEGLVEKDQPVRLLAHAGLTLARPDTTLVTNVGACALRGHLGFFIGEAAPAQQARESGRGSAYAMLVQQSRRQFGHGDVRPSLHRADQKRFVTGQLARATRPALASRGRRSALPLALHQLEGEAVADLEVAGCCPAGMAGLNKGRHPHAQIQGVAVGHNPPPVSRRESQFGPGRNLSNPPFGPTLYGVDTAFRTALTGWGLLYVVGIQSSTTLWPPGTAPLPAKPWSGKGRPPTRVRRDRSPAGLGARSRQTPAGSGLAGGHLAGGHERAAHLALCRHAGPAGPPRSPAA